MRTTFCLILDVGKTLAEDWEIFLVTHVVNSPAREFIIDFYPLPPQYNITSYKASLLRLPSDGDEVVVKTTIANVCPVSSSHCKGDVSFTPEDDWVRLIYTYPHLEGKYYVNVSINMPICEERECYKSTSYKIHYKPGKLGRKQALQG